MELQMPQFALSGTGPPPKKKPAKYWELLEVYAGGLFAVTGLWVWGGCDQVCLQV